MVLFVHAAPAAVAPLANYYASHAPELPVTHLLDDGLQRLLAAPAPERSARRFTELIQGAIRAYGIRAAVLTCSAVTEDLPDALARETGVPVLRIDDPLAHQGVQFARPGVLVSFAPALAQTRVLFERAATRAGLEPDVRMSFVEGAYDALRRGDALEHERLLVDAAVGLAAEGADAVLLSQISMACVSERVASLVGAPVLSSLSASLAAVRALAREEK